jgi:hypothetical protein
MVDVIIQTPTLDVFGGPASIDVSTDFGKPGLRGPIFWVGDKSPEAFFSISQLAQVNINDFFISTSPDPELYGWLYKRVPFFGVEGSRWEKVLSLDPQQHSSKDIVTFIEGVGILDILLTKITMDDPSIVNFGDRFIIRNNFENSAARPIASSFTYSIIESVVPDIYYLRIVFNAADFDGTSWNKLEGSHNVHSFVSYLV